MSAFGFEEPASAPNREELLRMAIRTAQDGNTTAARVMFREVLSSDARNERALMWMAKLADSKEERVAYLNRVLAVNPLNEQAREALDRIRYSRSARDNRVIVIFGAIAAVLVVVALVVILAIVLRPA
jgi:thioredoxin-like negative regulator of GroEL